MDYFRQANQRGVADFGWLKSKHSFSFGEYYDTKHMGYSVLRVINDDHVIGGAGFGTHGHANMEIISYVLNGVIEHKDNFGNKLQVPAGDIQIMSAGKGVTHSEYNVSKNEGLDFLQIWIQPNVSNIEPRYEQAKIKQNGPLTPLVTSDGRDGSLTMMQDANLYRLKLNPNESYQLSVDQRSGYLHLVEGNASVGDIKMKAGDGAGMTKTKKATVQAGQTGIVALWFDLPKG
ncbi:MAG: pirin family protein [Marinicellaceae bacterium]